MARVTTAAGTRMPLMRKVLSTGVFYFVVITMSNLTNVVLYSREPTRFSPEIRAEWTRLISLFLPPPSRTLCTVPSVSPSLQTFHTAASDAITSIMCSRLVLALFSPDSMSFVSERLFESTSRKQRRHHGQSTTPVVTKEGGRSRGDKHGIELPVVAVTPPPRLALTTRGDVFETLCDAEVGTAHTIPRPFEGNFELDRLERGAVGIRVERSTVTLAA